MANDNKQYIGEFAGKYRFLSNFAPVYFGVVLDGETYPTVEHAYQAAKTFDAKERTFIRMLSKPGQAKRAGRSVRLRGDWDAVKLDIMLHLLRQKFGNARLRDALLATGDSELVEGNYWGDTFWGKCAGVGDNHLGRLLMQVREEIQDGTQNTEKCKR